MLEYIVRVEVSNQMVLIQDEDRKSSALGIDVAIEEALRAVPHVLASVMEGNRRLIDTITLSISFSRASSAAKVYKLMDRAEKHSLGLFELIDGDDDEQIQILPDRD